MDCERYAKALSDVALGHPTPVELQAHLEACAACRSWLEQERRLSALVDGVLRGALSVEPSADLAARVRQRLHEGGSRPRAGVDLRWALAAAAVLALGVALLLRTQHAPGPAPRVGVRATPAPEPPRAEQAIPPPMPPHVPRRTMAPTAAPKPRRTEPEVIVPPGEEEALRRFVAALRDARHRAVPVLVAEEATRIRPIEIEPLSTGGTQARSGS